MGRGIKSLESPESLLEVIKTLVNEQTQSTVEKAQESTKIEEIVVVKPIEEDEVVQQRQPQISDAKFEVKTTESRGQGMFATQDIWPGDIILREKPLIVMPDKVFSNDDMDYIEEWLEKRLLRMSSEDRATFFNLADSRSENGEKSILGIFFTNDMSYIDDSAALFPVMARVNHNCNPNADFITRNILGVQDLVATDQIKKGEEIFISYLPSKDEGSCPSKIRKSYTRTWYGFNCNCSSCMNKDDDEIREKINHLHVKGVESLSSTECQDLIEKLIRINCKLPHQNLVCKAGFEKSLLGNEWTKAVQFFAAGFINDSILNGEGQNQWSFVTKSIPVCINNQIYLFPM